MLKLADYLEEEYCISRLHNAGLNVGADIIRY